MLYESTRGNAGQVSSQEAILRGLAPDGGLYVPSGRAGLAPGNIAGRSYKEVAMQVLGGWLDDWPREELGASVREAYSTLAFDTPEIAPLHHLDARTSVLELWHGPTCAFKDLALQILPRLVARARQAEGREGDLVVLVATSGDTGSAALAGFRDVPGTRVVVFYPEDGVSEVQRLQMTTMEGANVHAVGVRGGDFDAAQAGVKAIFGDKAFCAALAAAGLELSSANSINWGRLVPQIAYWFWAWARLFAEGRVRKDERVTVVVPTGNFGNILSAWYARAMGLPLGRLVCASNANDVLTRFLAGGEYDRRRALVKTMSPSMDIIVSSNLERLLFELGGRDPGQVRSWMESLAGEGHYAVPSGLFESVRDIFWGASTTEEETLASIRRTWRDSRYLADTHTAVALDALRKYREAVGDASPTIVASTASPFKFNAAVAAALFGEAAVKEAGGDEFRLVDLVSRECGLDVPRGLVGLRERPIRHAGRCETTGMKEALTGILGLARGGKR